MAESYSLRASATDVGLVVIGLVLLPLYWAIYRYNPLIFNMLQCAHVILVCLYTLMYANYLQRECVEKQKHTTGLRALNIVMIFTMILFFLLFIANIFWIVVPQNYINR